MSGAVITYDRCVGRWQPDARGRLEEAALALFAERGFEDTTVAAIAERAGLTERTFFRHFADKREVLFGGAGAVEAHLAAAVAAAPTGAAPMELVAAALAVLAPFFESRRELVQRRQAVIASTAELRERELIKLASMGAHLATALRDRGVAEPAASLAAQVGMSAFGVAFDQWVGDPGEDLAARIREAFDELRTLTAEPERGRSRGARPARSAG